MKNTPKYRHVELNFVKEFSSLSFVTVQHRPRPFKRDIDSDFCSDFAE